MIRAKEDIMEKEKNLRDDQKNQVESDDPISYLLLRQATLHENLMQLPSKPERIWRYLGSPIFLLFTPFLITLEHKHSFFEPLPFIVVGLIFVTIATNILYVRSVSQQIREYEQIRDVLIEKGQDAQVINLVDVPHFTIVDRLQIVFIIATTIATILWFLYPEVNRLEPLTIIYGFGTGLFGYFRTRLGMNSPFLNMLIGRE